MFFSGEDHRTTTYLSFHFGSALLLFLAFPHVLVLLLSLSERLQELVKDAKELIWLHLAGILTEELYCPQELWDQREEAHRLDLQQDTVEPCFTGDSLGLSSLKSEQGTSSRAPKAMLTQIWPTTDYSWGRRLEPGSKLRQRVCWVFFPAS